MKRIIAILITLTFVLSLVSCAVTPKDKVGKSTFERYAAASTPERQISISPSGIKLNDEFELEFKSKDDTIKLVTEFTMISDIDEQYKEKNGQFTMVDYLAKKDGEYVFKISGGVVENGALTRLPSSVLSAVNDAEITEHASDTAGMTVRFATTADEIKIVAEADVENAYSTDVTQKRGNYGFEVYVGSGTDREYATKIGEMLLSPVDKTYDLGTGYKEVLINLPQGTSLESLKIGFKNSYDGIGLPTERNYAPVVFYGSEITQGVNASKPGNAYTNLTGRLLDADVINLGFIGGVHGETAIANYIAGLGEISAFVMELDNGATDGELTANHYNFYKAVRTAYPEIPIIIMSDPSFSDEQITDSADRVATIVDTYNRAVSEGDDRVWFIDGGDMFPMSGDDADIYTSDMVTVNDTGMFFMATALYDIIKSAHTPDNRKLDTTRAPGVQAVIGASQISSNLLPDDASYTAISDIEGQYKTTSDGVTYVSYNAPQLEIGGINEPVTGSNGFFRLDWGNRTNYGNKETGFKDWQTVYTLAHNSSGGTIRFRTDADEIYLNVSYKNSYDRNNLSLRSCFGVDVYAGSGADMHYMDLEDQKITPNDKTDDDGDGKFTATVALPAGEKEVMIVFPLYGGIADISVGFDDASARIAAPSARDESRDLMVHYGPSIAQGASATRPGLSYSNIIARYLNIDNKNLGFSDSARGEQIMAEYIASFAREMDVFIMDYDHNSPTAELRENHYAFYQTVRASYDGPIILMSRPIYTVEPTADDNARYDIIWETYESVADEYNGDDSNVYLVDGREFFPYKELADLCMVDDIHPNDLGMYFTAVALSEVMNEIFGN